jgi:hypothetical protein
MSRDVESKLGRCLLHGTGGSAASPWRIVERNYSTHYTMIGYISTKLLLIGIIKNYNRGSFNLAVISLLPASTGQPMQEREAWEL